MRLSGLGIFHTIIGVAALVAAIASFVKHGKIELGVASGKLYFYGTLVTSVTSLGISKLGGFNPGHAFAIFIVLLVLTAYLLHARRAGHNKARFFENFCLSFSFFLSLVPTVNETFTRIPVGHPLAKDIKDPAIGNTLLVLFMLFIAGAVYQFIRQRAINRAATR